MSEIIPTEAQSEEAPIEMQIDPDAAQIQASPDNEAELPIAAPILQASQPEAVVADVASPAAIGQAAPEMPMIDQAVPPSQPAAPKAGAAYTRGDVIGFGLAFSLITLFLAVILCLGFLALVNGSLSFPSTARFNDLSRQVDTLQRDTSALRQDVTGLQTRVDALQAVSGRVDTIEKDTQALRTSLDDSARQVDLLQSRVTTLNQDVDGLKTKTRGFDDFLQGLRDLVINHTQP